MKLLVVSFTDRQNA